MLIARTWRQVEQGRALIVNKMGSEPKVTFSGAVVWLLWAYLAGRFGEENTWTACMIWVA